ncbi:ASPIC/UnbV domain-containing protein, partial [Desulfosarcina sp.]|nr:ASPIC/UnbV domain-containing protein [Desulfosarcina sp.]
ALMFDHDNDGDLDMFLTRYSWSNDGHTNIFENEGNDNSWIILTCEGTVSNRSAIGTRISAKCFVNGKHITQTREITPINGHISYANLRAHFGLGDADVIDTVVICWPSGYVDEYLNVAANHFYRAIEDDKLEIDFKATNYIQYSPDITDIEIMLDETISIDLKEHYHFIKGDTVPIISSDTLTFELYGNENPEAIAAELNGSILTLTGVAAIGESIIQITASTDFTRRMDQFNVMLPEGVSDNSILNFFLVHPNPFSNTIAIEFELIQPEIVTIIIYNHIGEKIEAIEKKQTQGKQQVVWNAEGLPAGVYFCVLKTNPPAGGQTIKMIKL